MTYYLSLGSNIGEREQTLQAAKQRIEQRIGPITRCSSYYYSTPWGYTSPNEFCNLCCCVETPMPPLDLLTATQTIERELGRTHKTLNGRYTDRTIDIDIIMAYEGKMEIQMQTPELTLPHPLWRIREFVCIPLSEIKNDL